MRASRRAIPILLVILASLLVVLVISLNSIIAKNHGRIQEEIEKSLGRSVTFGDLRLSFWGGVGISAKDLRIAEDPRFAATPFVLTKEVTMQLRLLPLLMGHIQIKKFVLDEPEIQIIKNEGGGLNLAALAGREKKAKEPREAKERRKRAAAKLLVSAVNVKNGRIDYIDRSSKEPIEVRVRNVDLEVKGLAPGRATKFKVSANLFEGQGQNMSVEGRIGPFESERDWTQYPIDLKLRFDSLLLPQLTRAAPFLREKISRYLDATGPVALQAKLQGTFERPRISDFTLTGPFFGATGNNTTAKGDFDFSKGSSWEEGEIKGNIAIDPVSLDQLKKIPFFKQSLPASLASKGPLSVAGEFQGSLDDLKIVARIKAEESEIRYGNWFKKEKGVPAETEVRIERQKERLVFEESTLTVHNLKVKFSGALEGQPERRLLLRLRTDGWNLAGGDKFLAPLSAYATGGNLRWDLSIKKSLSLQDAGLDISGSLNLDDTQAKDKKSGRGVEKMTARLSFRGKDARVEQLSLRLGSSDISLDGILTDFTRPTLRFTLRSPRLNLADVGGAGAAKGDEMKSLLSAGELQIRDGKAMLRGNLSSPEGTLQEVPYRNLRGEIAWSQNSLSFKNLSFQALSGSFRSNGSWERGTENSQRLLLDPNIEAVDLKALLAQKFPKFKDHIEGHLNFKARLRAESKDSSALLESTEGEGETQLRNGALKDFNLAQLVLSKVTGLPGMPNLRIPPRFAALAQRRDTPFDTLTGSFTIKQGRIYSKDLLLSTPGYSITADGSIGLDKSMKWNATLVMSPQFTQELLQEHKNVRYMLDRQGRLAIPFRLEGTLPQVQARPNMQALGELIQKGMLRKGMERLPEEGQKEKRKRDRREQIQKQLEQFFGK
jgi:uncharacterized protein involved in outer membrane biogenesis